MILMRQSVGGLASYFQHGENPGDTVYGDCATISVYFTAYLQ